MSVGLAHRARGAGPTLAARHTKPVVTDLARVAHHARARVNASTRAARLIVRAQHAVAGGEDDGAAVDATVAMLASAEHVTGQLLSVGGANLGKLPA